MKILVTGGAGFIGSHLVDRLIADGHEVTIFDCLDPQVHPGGIPPAHLNPEARFVQGDVRDYDALQAVLAGQEAVYHYAASVGVGQSQYQIKHYVDVNIGGTSNLLDILANHDNAVERVIVAASMSSYGEGTYSCDRDGRVRPEPRSVEDYERSRWEPRCPICGDDLRPIPITEQDKYISNSVYATTKGTQEDLVLNFGMAYDIPVVGLRFFNVYGPRQSLSNPYTGVAAIFMSRVKNDHAPVIYEDGRQTRDFVSVHDIVQASTRVLTAESIQADVFNVGTGNPISIAGVAETIIEVMGKDLTADILGEYRKGDIRHCYPSIEKLKTATGYEPTMTFQAGMQELMEWAAEADAEDHFEKAQSELRSRGLL
jgi:dTDP-L-rhamnose 4-epimerase